MPYLTAGDADTNGEIDSRGPRGLDASEAGRRRWRSRSFIAAATLCTLLVIGSILDPAHALGGVFYIAIVIGTYLLWPKFRGFGSNVAAMNAQQAAANAARTQAKLAGPDASTVRACPNCGREADADARFCSNCAGTLPVIPAGPPRSATWTSTLRSAAAPGAPRTGGRIRRTVGLVAGAALVVGPPLLLVQDLGSHLQCDAYVGLTAVTLKAPPLGETEVTLACVRGLGTLSRYDGAINFAFWLILWSVLLVWAWLKLRRGSPPPNPVQPA